MRLELFAGVFNQKQSTQQDIVDQVTAEPQETADSVLQMKETKVGCDKDARGTNKGGTKRPV